MWLGNYRFLSEEPERAQFMLQVDSSPYGREAHDLGMAVPDDPLMAKAASLMADGVLAPFDLDVLYDLAFVPAIRRAAAGAQLDDAAARAIATACWRAVTTG